MSPKLPKNACLDVSPEAIASMVHCPEWDIMMFGDGSGTGGWTMAGGWSCITVERETDHRTVCWGGWSTCDIFIAELSAYFQALTDLEATRAEVLRKHFGRPLKVLIVSDNEVIVNWAPTAMVGAQVSGHTNPIWAGLRYLAQTSGTSITWRFASRRSTMLNVLADQICGRVRRMVGDEMLGEYRSRHGDLRQVKQINPKAR